MERLTERNKNGLSMAVCCGKACEYNYACEVGGFGECRGMDDIIDRLADIEDILGDDYDLDRLRELVEADRDGRCVVLPCKPGDVVWLITNRGTKCVERWIVHRVYKRDTSEWYFDLKNMMLSLKRPNEFEMCKRTISSFGKTLFLTREAAEAALKGDQHEQNL